MIFFDLFLLFFVSGLLAIKSLYLGSITLIAGFLIGFQNQRTISLLGLSNEVTSTGRKIKAALLSIVIGVCALPLMMDQPATADDVSKWPEETILPIVILIGLFSAAMLAALTVEKRKR